jgi:hypothetical protein
LFGFLHFAKLVGIETGTKTKKEQHQMNSKHAFIRPKTLSIGVQYLFLDVPVINGIQPKPETMSLVNFEAYDVCPAFAIVRNGSGKRWRCERSLLFIHQKLI